MLRQEQMAGGGDRQIFGEALEHPENERLERGCKLHRMLLWLTSSMAAQLRIVVVGSANGFYTGRPAGAMIPSKDRNAPPPRPFAVL